MQQNDFVWQSRLFENSTWQSFQRKWWINHWWDILIAYLNMWYIQIVPKWLLRSMGLKRLPQQVKGIFSFAWMGIEKWQPTWQMPIIRRQKHNRSVLSIKWHLLNTSFSMNNCNIIEGNYCRKSGLWQPVPQAHLPNNLFTWWLLQKKRFPGRQT